MRSPNKIFKIIFLIPKLYIVKKINTNEIDLKFFSCALVGLKTFKGRGGCVIGPGELKARGQSAN